MRSRRDHKEFGKIGRINNTEIGEIREEKSLPISLISL